MFSMFKIPQKQYDDQDMQQRQQRLEEKRKQCIAEMGNKWVLHPDNAQKKLIKQRGF